MNLAVAPFLVLMLASPLTGGPPPRPYGDNAPWNLSRAQLMACLGEGLLAGCAAASIFRDGLESADTGAWSGVAP